MTIALGGLVFREVKNRLLPLRQGGTISGVCLMHDDYLLLEELPYKEEVADQIAEKIHEMAQEYASRGKSFDHICFGFDQMNLLVIAHGKYLIGVLFPKLEDVDLVRGIAMLCFSEQLKLTEVS